MLVDAGGGWWNAVVVAMLGGGCLGGCPGAWVMLVELRETR